MAQPGACDSVIVVTGGDEIDPATLPPVPADAPVVAADSGIERAHALGMAVTVAVGDFDSVAPEALAGAAERGAVVQRHPVDKDASDLELALDAAMSFAPSRLVVLGGHGGRFDHLLANALVLAGPAYAAVEVVAQVGSARLTVIRHQAQLLGAVGDLVSLLPMHGAARDVVTDGLRFALRSEDLVAGSTRGLSNELVAEIATVRIGGGVLLAIQPDIAAVPPHRRS